MAAKRKAKKAKRGPAKTSRAKKAAKAGKTKSSTKRTAKAATRKAPAKKAAKAPAKKKQIVGEGDYAASEKFLKDESRFVQRNKARIPAMGKAAEKALEGPEGDALREAEATAGARSRDIF